MFIGRKDDLEALKSLWEKPTASLITCRGRRRVGKSTLIEEFAALTATHFIAIESNTFRFASLEQMGGWGPSSVDSSKTSFSTT